MHKKTIIIFVVLIVISIATFLFIYQNENGDKGVDIVKNALPFGKSNDAPLSNTSQARGVGSDNTTKDKAGKKVAPKFFQIHKEAIAGAYLFEKKFKGEGSGDIVARYLEKGIGHIFETDMSTAQEERISNTTRLKIYEALWGSGGRSVIIRYLSDEDGETIRSFLIKLGKFKDKKSFLEQEIIKQRSPEETSGVFLPENIQEITVSKNDDKKIFYLINREGGTIGAIYNTDTDKTAQIFQSVFTEWLTQWPSKKIITLTSKPSGEVGGFLYFLNASTEKTTKILGNINGLTTLTSPDGKKIAYSESTATGFSLNIYDIKNRQSQQLPLNTLPEKCVWGIENTNLLYCAVPTNIPLGTYPDIWYQGLVSFSDEIWTIDTETFTTNLLINPSDTVKEEMDAINLQIDPTENFLLFTNKKDSSLWGLRLK